MAGFGGLDGEQQVSPSFFMPSLLFGRFGLACQTTFTAMLASYLGSHCKCLGRAGAKQTAIDDGGSSSSRIKALLRSYRYSVASQPLFFLAVALACIVPAAEAGCRDIDTCGDCNSNCPSGEFRVCRDSWCGDTE
jgi:hypothetical protein